MSVLTRDVLELPERLEAEDELEPLLEPVLVLEPELEVELERDLRGEREGSPAGYETAKANLCRIILVPSLQFWRSLEQPC